MKFVHPEIRFAHFFQVFKRIFVERVKNQVDCGSIYKIKVGTQTQESLCSLVRGLFALSCQPNTPQEQ